MRLYIVTCWHIESGVHCAFILYAKSRERARKDAMVYCLKEKLICTRFRTHDITVAEDEIRRIDNLV